QLVVHPLDVTGQRREIRYRQVSLHRPLDQAAVVPGQRLELPEADLLGGALRCRQPSQRLLDPRIVRQETAPLQAAEHRPLRDLVVPVPVERVEQLTVDRVRPLRDTQLTGTAGRPPRDPAPTPTRPPPARRL